MSKALCCNARPSTPCAQPAVSCTLGPIRHSRRIEIGRRGSRNYVSECISDPSVVKLMVNVDAGYEMHTGPVRVYVSNDEAVGWARENLNLEGIDVFTSESMYSDAGAFSAAGIHIFMASGSSKQKAHLPDDRPDNIDPHKLQVLGSLSLQAAVYAACGDSALRAGS